MPHAHDHHELKGAALTRAAQATLERAGEQWTSMRAAVFAALAELKGPASAYDVTEALSKRENRRIAANSVYRILDLFVGANLVRRVESENGYVVNAHPDCLHDCIFLVCDDCGRTIHVDDDAIGGSIRSAAEKAGYVPDRPIVEVRGRCSICVAKSGSPMAARA